MKYLAPFFLLLSMIFSNIVPKSFAGDEIENSEHIPVYFNQQSFLANMGFYTDALPYAFENLSSYMSRLDEVHVASENREKVRRYAIKIVQWYVGYWPNIRQQIGDDENLKFEFANVTQLVFAACANMLNRSHEDRLALNLNELVLTIKKETPDYSEFLLHTFLTASDARDPYFAINFGLDAAALFERYSLPGPGVLEDYRHIYEVMAQLFQKVGDANGVAAMNVEIQLLETHRYLDEAAPQMDAKTYRTIITDNFYNELLIPYLEDPELKNNLTFE